MRSSCLRSRFQRFLLFFCVFELRLSPLLQTETLIGEAVRSPCWSTRLRHLVGSFALVAAASTCVAVGAATPSFADGDDYPWAGQGQCPLKPVAAPAPAPTGKPGKP